MQPAIKSPRIKMVAKASLDKLTGSQLMFAEKYGIDEYISAKHKMCTQRWHAVNNRHLEWLFTDDEWFNTWLISNKWLERGTHKGGYAMCRYNDVGPYSKDNVRIDLHGQNTREASIGNTWGSAHKGRPAPWVRKKK